ncbi:PREDICTED: uncharacterized protein LOC104810461 [Tarenaya hassleriana]|uniref:uncharacterized protein LOC104810461 n=1 Tax=Tarenaya hassleriana TaxID=28532 RepID=UPI00053C5A37|nr:PREDICTED: uncharacterized protein LOC104810461 [Tarenaya hassleriana]
MEDHPKIQNSGEKNKPDDDLDFEFGSLTPSSPSQDPFSGNSPADHFFFNGRLLPHSFPTSRSARTISRTTSEASSGSNSSNSRSSCCSPHSYTPRTSSCSSTNSNMVMSPNKHKPRQLDLMPVTRSGKTVNTTNKSVNPTMTTGQPCKRRNKATELVTAQLCGSYSQRWQYITPVPGAAFKREGSVKRGGAGGIRVGGGGRRPVTVVAARRRKKGEERRGRGSRVMRWWRRILRAVVLACRECHAMEPARVVNDDTDMQRKNKNF